MPWVQFPGSIRNSSYDIYIDNYSHKRYLGIHDLEGLVLCYVSALGGWCIFDNNLIEGVCVVDNTLYTLRQDGKYQYFFNGMPCYTNGYNKIKFDTHYGWVYTDNFEPFQGSFEYLDQNLETVYDGTDFYSFEDPADSTR